MSGRVETEQSVDGPLEAVPPVRPPIQAAGRLETSPAEPAGPAPVPATSGVNPTSGDGGGDGPDSFPPAGFPLRYPGGQTGPQRSVAADTVEVTEPRNTSINSRQPPALPPRAQTAAAEGLTQALPGLWGCDYILLENERRFLQTQA